MPRERFTQPGTKRLEISDGDWLLVKTGLNAGDQRKQDTLAVVPVLIDGRTVDRIDWSMYEFLRTDLWLVDWSLTKTENGKTVAITKSVDALRALDPDDFDEINNAVYRHIVEWVASRKKRGVTERTLQQDDNASPTSQS